MIKIGAHNINLISQSTGQKNNKITKNKKTTRVEEIKQQVQNGSYKIDLQKTAESMIKYFLI